MGLLQLRSRAPDAPPEARAFARLVTAGESPKLLVSNCRVKSFEQSAGAGSDGAVTGSIAKWSEQGRMKELLARIAEAKDEAAFRQLFEAYRPRLRSFMLRSGANSDTADELVQEAMLSVWRKAALYQPDKGTVSAWIFAIARNLRIDRLRREFDWQELPPEMEQVLPADTTPPDEEVSDRQRQSRVRSVLSELGPEQREIVTLAYIDGLSHTQIAEKLNLPLGTVKSRMRLAYQKVRTGLEDLR